MINPLKYNRRTSRRVYIGHIPLGSNEKIRLQSMTNTDTSDIQKTADQVIEIFEAGAEYVRITVQSSNVAEKIPLIKSIIDKKGYTIPLIADIHFSPKAAEISAKYIDKVRINPGNYIDKKQFKHIDYTDDEYSKEINRIRENIIPLIKLCKENKTAIRIGTNHGSLSDRIMSRYGDTPLGMVESTMGVLKGF
jgi:(E)-4-hydroxy-3-methylbut-2-enyl-diphosphate synthase